MRGKPTILLALAALALLLYIVLIEVRRPAAESVAALRLFPGFNPATVQAVQFQGVSNIALRAERAGVEWRLSQPVPYAARTAAVNGFLDAVAKLESAAAIGEADIRRQTNGLAAYGLEPPQSVLRLEAGTNTHELRLGIFSPLGDRLYVQLAGQPGIHACGSNFFLALPRTIYAWRDPSLVKIPEGSFDRMEVRAGGRGFEVQLETNSGLWRIAQPLPARADNAKLQHLFQQARQWAVAGFVSDAPDADLQPFGLNPPALEVTWARGSNAVQRLQFGRTPDATNDASAVLTNFVYARRIPDTNIVLAPRAHLDALAVPFNEFRDRRLAAFDRAQVSTIEIRGEDAFALQRQPDGRWRVTEPLNFAADASIAEDILLTFESLDVLEFVKDVVTDFSAYGLDKPARQYAFRQSVTNAAGVVSNRTLIEVDIGTNVAERVYARRRDEDSVYLASYGSILRLPQARFEVRDRRLALFPMTNIVSVTYHEQDRARRFTPSPDAQWAVDDDGVVNPFGVQETLVRLADLQVSAWTARGREKLEVYGFNRVRRRVEVEHQQDGEKRTAVIEFGGFSQRLQPFASVVLDGETILFECPEGVYDHVEAFLGFPRQR